MNRAVLCMTSRHKNLLYIICLKIKVQKKNKFSTASVSLCVSVTDSTVLLKIQKCWLIIAPFEKIIKATNASF